MVPGLVFIPPGRAQFPRRRRVVVLRDNIQLRQQQQPGTSNDRRTRTPLLGEDRGFRGYVGKCQSNSRSIVLQPKTSVIRSSKLTPKIGGFRKQHGGGREHQQYGANWAPHVWSKPHFWTNPHGKSPSLHLGFLQKKCTVFAVKICGLHEVFWL